MASWFFQSPRDPYDLSSDDEDYLMRNNVGWNNTQTKRLGRTFIDNRMARFEFTFWITAELGAK